MDTVTAAPAGTELEGMTAELPAPKGTVVEPDGEIGQCPWTSVAWIAAGDAQLESTEETITTAIPTATAPRVRHPSLARLPKDISRLRPLNQLAD